MWKSFSLNAHTLLLPCVCKRTYSCTLYKSHSKHIQRIRNNSIHTTTFEPQITKVNFPAGIFQSEFPSLSCLFVIFVLFFHVLFSTFHRPLFRFVSNLIFHDVVLSKKRRASVCVRFNTTSYFISVSKVHAYSANTKRQYTILSRVSVFLPSVKNIQQQ